MPAWLEKLTSVPWIAHILATVQRFTERLGFQFAAAITYFSVLSIVPMLMVAFAGLGLTLTVFLPDLLDRVKGWITAAVSGQGDLGVQINAVVDQAFNSWQAVGVVGLLTALWSGQTWVANIRSAVRVMMRASFDVSQEPANIAVETLKNLAMLLGLFVLSGLTMAMSTVATAARDVVGRVLGLDTVPGGDVILSLAPLLGTLLAGFVLFCAVFTVFPDQRVPLPVLLRGAAIGAVGLTLLQMLTGLLVRAFSGNPAAAVFGSVIVVMLYFNLLATLILMVASWMATHRDVLAPDVTLADHVPAGPTTYATKQLVAELERVRSDAEVVPTAVASRRQRASLGLGAVAVAAVTLVAAAVASVIAGLRGRG